MSDGLSWLVSKSSPSTFTMFHYSGHVKQTSAGEYLWPYDNRFLARRRRRPGPRRPAGDVLDRHRRLRVRRLPARPSRNERPAVHLLEPGQREVLREPAVGHVGLARACCSTRPSATRRPTLDHDKKVSVQEAYQWATPRAATITSKQRPHGPQHPQHAGWKGSLNLANPPHAALTPL